MRSIDAVLFFMHAAGVSKSQIEHHADGSGFVFVRLPATVQAASDRLTRMAQIAKVPISDQAIGAFLPAFFDVDTRRACVVVDHFGNGFQSRAQVRSFLRALHWYVAE
jgi:hypothetical protein